MARGFPSMTALLGLLAVAGYQNRDKIGEWLNSVSAPGGSPSASTGPGGSGLNELLRNVGGTSGTAGGFLGGALSELVNSFKQNGQGDVVDSWVRSGPNQEIQPDQLKRGISPDVLNALSQQTGLSEAELLQRLSRELPHAVDKYTPDGQLPSA